MAPAATSAIGPVPTRHERRDALEAPHAGSIQTLALSPDGTAVLSADELGGVRLWPTLDGTQEPRVVAMPRPTQLAVAHRPGGFTAVSRDEAGGLYIAKLDDAGRQLSHATVAAEPAVTGMVMTANGLVAWRSDQTLVVLDADGAIQAQLATEPRQRLVTVAVAGTRAVALLERGGAKRQARWLAFEPKLAWGAWIDLEQELRGTVELALSPNARRLAATLLADRKATAVVFELATGKELASGTIQTTRAEIAFADDDHVALGGNDGLSWIDLTRRDATPSKAAALAQGPRAPAVVAAGRGRAITAWNSQLALTRPDGTSQFLGYGAITPRIAEVGPDGRTVIGIADELLVLDPQLRVEATLLAGITGTPAQLRWLGESDWLLESPARADGTMQIALVNASSGSTVLRTGLAQPHVVHYEPSTQLVTLSLGASPEVARFDRTSRTLARVAGVTTTRPYEQVMLVPVSPALAGGTKLVRVTMRERTTIEWLRDPSALDKAVARVTVDGPFAGADAAGRVYAWQSTPAGGLELALYAGGTRLRTLPNSGAVALWPEPTGTRYLGVTPTSVALHDLHGAQLWLRQLVTSQDALWLTDGSIVVASGGGVARLDAASGAVIAARCGWKFGLALKPHPASPRVEPLCAQLH